MPSSSIHVSCRAHDDDKHTKDVTSLLYVNGKLYSGGDDGQIKVWSQDLTLLGQAEAHPTSVFSLSASADTLFTCSNEGTVKGFELNTLKEKGVLLNEKDFEFWVVRYVDGVLYAGDDQGNVKIVKEGSSFGEVNVAQPVKDIAVNKNYLFTVNDKDVVVTDLHLGGDKPQFGVMKTVEGRAPIIVSEDRAFFTDRGGKSIVLNEASHHFSEITQVTDAHSMIINALAASNWNGTPLLFSGGWDKILKQWKVENNRLLEDASLNVDLVINALAVGDQGLVYAAGSDGHIVRVDV